MRSSPFVQADHFTVQSQANTWKHKNNTSSSYGSRRSPKSSDTLMHDAKSRSHAEWMLFKSGSPATHVAVDIQQDRQSTTRPC